MATVRRTFVKGGVSKLNHAIKDLGKLYLQVGWFESAKYDDKKSTPVAYVAAIQEFGKEDERIPPRPFVRPTIENHKTEWKSLSAAGIKGILNGTETSSSVMEKMGLRISGQIRKSIRKVDSPALSQTTIQKRLIGRKNKEITATLKKPLVHEGILLNSVSYIVQGGSVKSPFGDG